jgi:hypothetical protein
MHGVKIMIGHRKMVTDNVHFLFVVDQKINRKRLIDVYVIQHYAAA